MRGAIYTVDPEYRRAVEDAYASAKEQGIRTAVGYCGNNFNEYWAGGIEAYTASGGGNVRTRDALQKTDPRLYELVQKVIPSHPMPGNIFRGRERGTNSSTPRE